MDRAALVLGVPVTGNRRAIRVAKADLETRGIRTRRKLRRHSAHKRGVKHERIGGDPADELAPEARS